MRWMIHLPGRPALGYVQSGIEFYLQRLRPFGRCELVVHRAQGSVEQVGRRLLKASAGSYRVVLDERGKLWKSRGWAGRLQRLREDPGVKEVSFLIGAADGHSAEVRGEADELLALTPLTLQHELAALVLCEQLYRAASIQAGTPYHRD